MYVFGDYHYHMGDPGSACHKSLIIFTGHWNQRVSSDWNPLDARLRTPWGILPPVHLAMMVEQILTSYITVLYYMDIGKMTS